MTRPYMEPNPIFMDMERFKHEYKQEIAHIYDLLNNICTFKKVRFNENSEWTQSSDGYYKLTIPSTNFVALAAFENIDGATDKRANCVIDTNKKYVTVTSTYPFDGYIVAADVDFDDDDTISKKTNDVAVDRELSVSSLNPVTNRAITLAINSLMAQVSQISFPASLPASDVYSWAKTKNKPCYTWDEICGKPNVVTEIVINGKKLKNVGGTVVLDKIVDLIEIPKKLSDLELDASVYDLVDGDALKATLETLIDNDDNLTELINGQTRRITNVYNELQANDDDLARSLDTTNSRLSALSNKVTQNSLAVANEIATAVANCKTQCDNERAALKEELDQAKHDLHAEDNILHGQLSALAHECRLHHDMYDSMLASIASDITKLQASSAEALVELIKSELTTTEANVAALSGKVKILEDNQVTITKPEGTNGVLTINGKNVVVYDDTALNTYTQGIAEDVDDIKDKLEIVEQAAEQALELNAKITANEESIAAAEQAIENLTDTVEENAAKVEKELKNAAAASGLKVAKSETNGNVTLLYPKKDAEGNVVYTEAGEVVYDEANAEEIEVYKSPEGSELLGKVLAEAQAIVDEKGEDAKLIPTKVSDLENDLNYITRKQAAGLVASATVNFDTAFEDDDPSNITYVKTVNISDSQGSVLVNGDNIIVNVDGIGEMQETINTNTETITNNTERIVVIENTLNTISDNSENIIQLGTKVDALETDVADIKDKLDGIDVEALQNEITELQNKLAEQESLNSDQADLLVSQQTTIARLENANTSLVERVAKLEELFATFVDADGVLSDGEQPLWEKQDQANAVTDEDAMSAEDIEGLYNEIE